MFVSSDHQNILSSPLPASIVRMSWDDARRQCSYNPKMPRKALAPRPTGPDWFLKPWMETLGVTQAELARRTGWSKPTTNDIFHGKTGYYRQIVNEAARALGLHPFELLMPPAEAMAIRRVRESALRIAAEARIDFLPEPGLDGTHG